MRVFFPAAGSVVFDAPVHHIRPHLQAVPTSHLEDTGFPVPAEEPPTAAAIADAVAFIEQRRQFEVDNDCDAAEFVFMISDTWPTLVSLAMTVETGSQHIHAIYRDSSNIVATIPAKRDMMCIFNIGRNFAQEKSINQYGGVIIASARRFISGLRGTRSIHLFYWIGDSTAPIGYKNLDGARTVDVLACTETTIKTLQHLRFVAILEAHPEGQNTLLELFDRVPLNDGPEPPENPARVRIAGDSHKITEAPVVPPDDQLSQDLEGCDDEAEVMFAQITANSILHPQASSCDQRVMYVGMNAVQHAEPLELCLFWRLLSAKQRSMRAQCT